MIRPFVTLLYFLLTSSSIVFTACVNNGESWGLGDLGWEKSIKPSIQMSSHGYQFTGARTKYLADQRAHPPDGGGHREGESAVVLRLPHDGRRGGLRGCGGQERHGSDEEVPRRGVHLHGECWSGVNH